ncbi:MAG: bifunctional RNase H/acid phosphatase [Sporichthyaceae bacterium]
MSERDDRGPRQEHERSGAQVSGRRLVVEADGAARGNPGPASFGAVVRDAATGEVLAERSEALGTATNNVAEYSGLIAALETAFYLDPSASVEVRMDSKLVVEQMAGRWKVKHPNLKPLVARAHAAIPPGAVVRWTWIPREQNAHADGLANAALDGRAPEPVEVVAAPTVGDVAVTKGPSPKLIGWAGDLGTTTSLLLLRHGVTPHTAERRFSGPSTDPPLSDLGERQAAATARHLAQRGGVDVVVSSPLRRARQTAEAAADALGLEVLIEEDLREADFGMWDGLTFAEVSADWGTELAEWLSDASIAPPGGGESLYAVAHRVAAAQERLLADHAGANLLVVAHVTPIKLLVRLALAAEMHLVHRLQLAPTSLSQVCWYGDGNSALHSFNDTGHLGDLARTDGQ